MRRLSIFGALSVLALASASVVSAAGGFDQYGYNNTARVFNGTGESWSMEKGLPANYLGIYSKDKLVMKWNAQWDACNDAGNLDPDACTGAWLNNEWNGRGVKGGSGSVWHYKFVWVGACTNGVYFADGGYCIWNAYEVLMDQGQDPNLGPGHLWYAHATPGGYGSH